MVGKAFPRLTTPKKIWSMLTTRKPPFLYTQPAHHQKNVCEEPSVNTIWRIFSRKRMQYSLLRATHNKQASQHYCVCIRIHTYVDRDNKTRRLRDHHGSKRFRISRMSTVVTVSYAACRQAPRTPTSQHTSTMLTQQQQTHSIHNGNRQSWTLVNDLRGDSLFEKIG